MRANDVGPGLLRHVHITRLGRGQLDVDNLAISAKHVLDGIADAVGINDRDLQVTYAQERCGVYAVRLELSEQKGAAS